jgi:hypothetical protein
MTDGSVFLRWSIAKAIKEELAEFGGLPGLTPSLHAVKSASSGAMTDDADHCFRRQHRLAIHRPDDCQSSSGCA